MRILRFEASKLHGYLTFDLKFFRDITFLTGINGSGKTSAVRSIISLLSPSFNLLAETEFEFIRATVEHEGTEISIKCEKDDESLIVFCSSVKGNLHIPIAPQERYESSTDSATRRQDFYREQYIKHSDNPILKAIQDIPSPMYLDLDRKSGSGTILQRKGRLYPVRIHANPLAGTIGESLNIAESLAGRAYQGFLEEQKRQTDILKQEIVLAAFRPMNTSKFGDIAPQPTQKSKYLKQITHNEGVLPSALAQIGVTEERITNIVQPFFENAKYVINRVPSFKEIQQGQHIDTEKLKSLQEFSAITPQLRQVDQLVDLIERYNTDLSKTYLPFKLYLDSVNGFLEESGKSISFTNSGHLCVITGEDDKGRELSTLSSGERQLVVILTHLAFNSRAILANVLIIDEPELSLHLRWQELFVGAIKAASPDIQMVLATHSPSIIGSLVKNCIDIMEARRNDRLF